MTPSESSEEAPYEYGDYSETLSGVNVHTKPLGISRREEHGVTSASTFGDVVASDEVAAASTTFGQVPTRNQYHSLSPAGHHMYNCVKQGLQRYYKELGNYSKPAEASNAKCYMEGVPMCPTPEETKRPRYSRGPAPAASIAPVPMCPTPEEIQMFRQVRVPLAVPICIEPLVFVLAPRFDAVGGQQLGDNERQEPAISTLQSSCY